MSTTLNWAKKLTQQLEPNTAYIIRSPEGGGQKTLLRLITYFAN